MQQPHFQCFSAPSERTKSLFVQWLPCFTKWGTSMWECFTVIQKCTRIKKRFGFSDEWRFWTQSDGEDKNFEPPSTGAADVANSYLVSSATSTSVGAVIGAFECPAVGSSVFSSPFVELITCTGGYTQSSHANQKNDTWKVYLNNSGTSTIYICIYIFLRLDFFF